MNDLFAQMTDITGYKRKPVYKPARPGGDFEQRAGYSKSKNSVELGARGNDKRRIKANDGLFQELKNIYRSVS